MNIHSSIDAKQEYADHYARIHKEYDDAQFTWEQITLCTQEAVHWFNVQVINRVKRHLLQEQEVIKTEVRLS
ncbi:hypothetical protein KFU94_21685 [Chloroflexi bacterium TSY]|nr:hypothetical protein [Chloroflexi bacterium TSY]